MYKLCIGTALQEMGKSLETSQTKVDRNIAVTRNTFKTVTTGASLLQLIQESSQDYSELISFNPPLLETISKTLKAAYAYWLKANAQLQAMGIYPLALPDALRSYQMSLDIEE